MDNGSHLAVCTTTGESITVFEVKGGTCKRLSLKDKYENNKEQNVGIVCNQDN